MLSDAGLTIHDRGLVLNWNEVIPMQDIQVEDIHPVGSPDHKVAEDKGRHQAEHRLPAEEEEPADAGQRLVLGHLEGALSPGHLYFQFLRRL